MAALAPYLLIAGTVASTGASIAQGIGASRMAKYNAAVAMRQAQAERDKAAFDERRIREVWGQRLSTARALYGKAGVDEEGSPLEVLGEMAGQGELDALAIRYGGDIAASASESEAGLYKVKGRMARTKGFMEAGSSLLAGAGRYGEYKLGIGGYGKKSLWD